MKVIYRYKLNFINKLPPIIDMPVGAQIRCVHAQAGDVYLWAEVDPKAIYEEPRYFHVVGTGWKEIADNMTYVGTAFVATFVWHVYEEKK